MLDNLLAKNLLPDVAIRYGIRRLLKQRLKEENRGGLEADHAWLLKIVNELKTS